MSELCDFKIVFFFFLSEEVYSESGETDVIINGLSGGA